MKKTNQIIQKYHILFLYLFLLALVLISAFSQESYFIYAFNPDAPH